MDDTVVKKQKRTYVGMDLFKLIAAVLIVFLHAVESESGVLAGVKYVFTRFAVPFFFLSSGFFYQKSLTAAHQRACVGSFFKKYMKRLLLLYGVWVTAVSPIIVFNYINKYRGDTLKTALVIVRRIFFEGPWQYWYMLALIYSVAIITFVFVCDRKWLTALFNTVCVSLFLINIYCPEPLNVFTELIDFAGMDKFVFEGLLYTYLGCLVQKYNIRISTLAVGGVFLLGTALRIADFAQFWVFDTGIAEALARIGNFLQAVSFLLIGLNLKLPRLSNISTTMRGISGTVYFSHTIFMYLFLPQFLKPSPVYPILLFGLALACSCAVYAVVVLTENKTLKFLFNA